MNQFAETLVVAAIRDGPLKWTLDATADRTAPQAVGIGEGVGGKHALAADGTDLAAKRFDSIETIQTDGKPGNIEKGQAAEATVGGKQNREEAFCGTDGKNSQTRRNFSQRNIPRNNKRPYYCHTGSVSRDSVLATAEDGLLAISRIFKTRELHPQYNGHRAA